MILLPWGIYRFIYIIYAVGGIIGLWSEEGELEHWDFENRYRSITHFVSLAEFVGVYEGKDRYYRAEERREEREKWCPSPARTRVLGQHHPPVGVSEVSDWPDDEEEEYYGLEDIGEAGALVFLHVDAVGQVEVVERNGEEYEGREDADDDAYDSVLDSALLIGYPWAALTMLLTKFQSIVKMMRMWQILSSRILQVTASGT